MAKTRIGTVVEWRNSAPGLAVFRLMPESGASFPHYKAGQYIALTNGLPGVTPGEYRVTIVRNAADDLPALPTKYSDPKTSSLTVTVKPGANSFDFALNTN